MEHTKPVCWKCQRFRIGQSNMEKIVIKMIEGFDVRANQVNQLKGIEKWIRNQQDNPIIQKIRKCKKKKMYHQRKRRNQKVYYIKKQMKILQRMQKYYDDNKSKIKRSRKERREQRRNKGN